MTDASSASGSRTDGPLMNEEQFGAYIERRLTLHDDTIQVVARHDLQLSVRVGEQQRPVETDLRRLYDAYRKNPALIDAVFQTFVHVLLDEMPETRGGDFEAIKERIYPMLKPIEFLAAVRDRKVPMLAYSDFLGGLVVAYVIDEQRSVAYISEEHLDTWKVSVLDLHAQALENLRRRTNESVDYVTAGDGERRLFIFNSGDGYDAARLLLTDVLAGWASELPGNLLIGVPNRDFLIGFSDADDEIVNGVAQQIQADVIGREQGLTEQLFIFQGGQVQVYDEA